MYVHTGMSNLCFFVENDSSGSCSSRSNSSMAADSDWSNPDIDVANIDWELTFIIFDGKQPLDQFKEFHGLNQDVIDKFFWLDDDFNTYQPKWDGNKVPPELSNMMKVGAKKECALEYQNIEKTGGQIEDDVPCDIPLSVYLYWIRSEDDQLFN